MEELKRILCKVPNFQVLYIDRGEKKNNIITLSFYAENLKEEYKRIKELNICKMSEIMYVNITEPYYYFNIFDPEGNTIEICSNSL